MILGIRHTGIVVRDLSHSLVFYRDLLGLKIWKESVEEGEYISNVVGIENVQVKWAKLQVPGSMELVELLEYQSHPDIETPTNNMAANQIGCPHIAFTVEKLEKLYSLLQIKGYTCKSAPQKSPDGNVSILYCHDPDGIIVELVEELT